MTWSLTEIAAVAEIIGLLAIVPSLIFVGVQLVRANRETRASTMQSALDSQMNMIATTLSYADTWEKVLSNAPLEEGVETRTSILLFNLFITEMENRYHQYQSGYLDPKSWEGHQRGIRLLIALRVYPAWRASPGATYHSTDFLELLDSLAVEVSEK